MAPLPTPSWPDGDSARHDLSLRLLNHQEDHFLAGLAQALGDPAIAQQLDIDARVNSWDDDCLHNLAMVAALRGMPRALRALLDAGADPNCAFKASCPLGNALAVGEFECAKLLIERGALVEGPPGSPLPPLHHGAAGGSVECCFLLLQAGADPSRLDGGGLAASQRGRRFANAANACDAIDAWVEAQALRQSAAPASPGRAPSL